MLHTVLDIYYNKNPMFQGGEEWTKINSTDDCNRYYTCVAPTGESQGSIEVSKESCPPLKCPESHMKIKEDGRCCETCSKLQYFYFRGSSIFLDLSSKVFEIKLTLLY